ncbi:tail fiber assembly protein [Providencia manganoxydans]|uniref:tail fiber assembly protein n=1 Tax=Providencia manganoxydans TaxID=2923283 RepID=UPI0034E46C4D
MIYYKDTENHVYSYAKSDIEQVSKLTELEALIAEQEPIYANASANLQRAETELASTKELLELEISKTAPEGENEADWQIQHDESIKKLTLDVDEKTTVYHETLGEFNYAKSAYLPLKSEFDNILSVFFDIREHLKTVKKMTPKEVEAHLNPPISKEQLIAEAEQKKQSLLAEANNVIAPLQDAVDLGMATDEEKASLQEWKKYRVLLNRVDTPTAPNIEWPEKP